jgi:NADH:ubiquinone oxidoreductase subunit 3 (subunit A)
MWFDIIGVTLGFVGSVIFSAGLIKSKEQIRDENQSYWGGNPFTTSAALSSQPYYIVAFILIITGFAVTLGGMLGEVYGAGSILVSILFSTSISLLGALATALLYIHNVTVHQKKKIQNAKQIFANSMRTYRSAMRGMEGKSNKEELFAKDKATYQRDLLEKARAIPEPENTLEKQAISEIDTASMPKHFVKAVDNYFTSSKL